MDSLDAMGDDPAHQIQILKNKIDYAYAEWLPHQFCVQDQRPRLFSWWNLEDDPTNTPCLFDRAVKVIKRRAYLRGPMEKLAKFNRSIPLEYSIHTLTLAELVAELSDDFVGPEAANNYIHRALADMESLLDETQTFLLYDGMYLTSAIASFQDELNDVSGLLWDEPCLAQLFVHSVVKELLKHSCSGPAQEHLKCIFSRIIGNINLLINVLYVYAEEEFGLRIARQKLLAEYFPCAYVTSEQARARIAEDFREARNIFDPDLIELHLLSVDHASKQRLITDYFERVELPKGKAK